MADKALLMESLTQQLRDKDFVLPILPEICQRVRNALDDPNTDASKLAKIISTDPALAARVVQAANSALFSGMGQVPSIQSAVARLGFVCVQNIIMSLTIGQLYDFKHNPLIKKHLVELWHQSTQIAACSAYLAKKFTPLDPYESLLGGLLHNIGALPVVVICSGHEGIKQYPELLPDLIGLLKDELGSWLLKQWNFSEAIQPIPLWYNRTDRKHTGLADQIDVVCVAHLLISQQETLSEQIEQLQPIQAFYKLGIDVDNLAQLLEDAQSDIRELSAILKG